jgi:hypothetical protein
MSTLLARNAIAPAARKTGVYVPKVSNPTPAR